MTRIINTPTMTWTAITGALSRVTTSTLFTRDIAPVLWEEAVRYNVDPLGVIAQAAHETGFGQFGGAIDARWRNTCGLKIRDLSIVPGSNLNSDLPLCHASFPSWSMGARAHVEHLVAYAGGTVFNPVDPRYVWVAGKNKCVEFRDLSTRWAPSTTYGDKIEAMISRLRTA